MKKQVIWLAALIFLLAVPTAFAAGSSQSLSSGSESLSTSVPKLKSLEERECVLGWLDDGGEVILPPGDRGFLAEFEDGTKVSVCRGVIAFGQEAEVQSIFGNPITVTLATLDSVCGIFPASCGTVTNDVVRLDFGRTGFRCPVGAGELTTDWFQLTAPSGLTTFVCRFKR